MKLVEECGVKRAARYVEPWRHRHDRSPRTRSRYVIRYPSTELGAVVVRHVGLLVVGIIANFERAQVRAGSPWQQRLVVAVLPAVDLARRSMPADAHNCTDQRDPQPAASFFAIGVDLEPREGL